MSFSRSNQQGNSKGNSLSCCPPKTQLSALPVASEQTHSFECDSPVISVLETRNPYRSLSSQKKRIYVNTNYSLTACLTWQRTHHKQHGRFHNMLRKQHAVTCASHPHKPGLETLFVEERSLADRWILADSPFRKPWNDKHSW